MVDAVLARSAADPTFARQVAAAVRTALLAKARVGLLPPG
jgi:beta-N-acetylhexosaminidase